jgi:four helix bundle protein
MLHMAKTIEDLQVLKSAEELADGVWKQIVTWKPFERDTVGNQLARSVDSIGANIAEAYGRYHYGEKLQFLYYARGSLYETKYWLNRVDSRQLMSRQDTRKYIEQIGTLTRQLNGFLAHIKRQRHHKNSSTHKTIREESVKYETTQLQETDLFSQEDILYLETIPNNE